MRIGYARVSTEEQNLQAQIDALQQAGCERIESEKVSSRKEERLKLREVLGWLRRGDVLVCVKMDRLARSVRELTNIMDELQKREVDVIFLDQRVDTSTPGGKLLFHVFAAFAEFERDLIRERTNAGLAAARARGRKGGRKKEVSDKKLRAAFDMYDKKEKTVGEICEITGLKERTFYYYLKKRQDALSVQ